MKGYLRIEPVLEFGNDLRRLVLRRDDPDETTIVLDITQDLPGRRPERQPDSRFRHPRARRLHRLRRHRRRQAGRHPQAGAGGAGVAEAQDLLGRPQDFAAASRSRSAPASSMRKGHGAPYYVAIGASLCGQRQDPARVHVDLRRRDSGRAAAGLAAGLVHGGPRADAGAGRGAGRAAHLRLEPQPAHSHARRRRRTRLSDRDLQPHDRAAGSQSSSRSQFSTDVSHELRTPITAIRGQLEVALFTAKTTEQYREAMFNACRISTGCRRSCARCCCCRRRNRADGAAEVAPQSLRSGRRPRGAVPDSGRGRRRAPDRRTAARSAPPKWIACRSSA